MAAACWLLSRGRAADLTMLSAACVPLGASRGGFQRMITCSSSPIVFGLSAATGWWCEMVLWRERRGDQAFGAYAINSMADHDMEGHPECAARVHSIRQALTHAGYRLSDDSVQRAEVADAAAATLTTYGQAMRICMVACPLSICFVAHVCVFQRRCGGNRQVGACGERHYSASARRGLCTWAGASHGQRASRENNQHRGLGADVRNQKYTQDGMSVGGFGNSDCRSNLWVAI